MVGAHRGGKTVGHSQLVGVGTRGSRGGGKQASRGGGSVRSQQTQHRGGGKQGGTTKWGTCRRVAPGLR